MKQIFTQSACLFWALLLTAVFSSETAVGQQGLMQPIIIDFNTPTEVTSGDNFELVELDINNTAVFKTQVDHVSSHSNGLKKAYIQATEGNNVRYHGLIKVKDKILFRRGYTYKVKLTARSSTGTGAQQSAGQITFFTSTNSFKDPNGNASIANATAHGSDALVFSADTREYELSFDINKLTTVSQELFVGFRLHTPTSNRANKSYMYVNKIEITESICPSNITVPQVTVTSAPACGEGQVVLTASGASANETYRWYASQADYDNGVYIPNQTAATFTTPSLDATATYYATIATAAGCESSPRAVTVTINQLPATPGSITGNSSVCVGTEGVVYSVPQVAGVTYNWIVPTGASIVSGANTNTITVDFSNTAQSGQVSVASVSTANCYSAARSTMQVTVNLLPSAQLNIVGPVSYCPSTTSARPELSVPTGTGYKYQWYNGDVLLPGETRFNFIPLVSGNFKVVVTNSSNCSATSNSVSIEVQEELTSDGQIELISPSVEKGESVTYRVSSDMQDRGHAYAVAWFRVSESGQVTALGGGATTTVDDKTYNEVSFIAPEDKFTLRCEITPNQGLCYSPAVLRISSEIITPLPVEIIYFTAAKQGNNVLLEWATASEENNTGFEVQVSQDGFNFRKLDFVPTKNGNTVIKQLYTFKDTENGKYGTRYYRLKQIDMDGQFEYFTTKAVSFGEVSNYSLKAFPNPFEGEVNLELNADESGKLNVQVLDAMGRSVMTQQFEVSKGRSLEKITLWQSLPKGIYFVRTEMNGQANNFKLLKK